MATAVQNRLTTFSERLRYAVIPPSVYTWYRARRDLRKYEPELQFLRHIVDPDRCSVDAGANRGAYTYYLSRLCSQVYAYEPNPAMRDILTRSVRGNVTVSNAALSDKDGTAVFSVPLKEAGARNNAGSLEQNSQMDGELIQFEVPVRRLDDENLPAVGFIKLDVEGHELAVLKGAEGILKRDRPVLLIEIMDGLMCDDTRDTIKTVEAYGYRAHALIDLRLVDARLLDSVDSGSKGFDRRCPTHRSNNFIFLPDGDQQPR